MLCVFLTLFSLIENLNNNIFFVDSVYLYISIYFLFDIRKKKEIIGASVGEVKFGDLSRSLFATFVILIPIFSIYTFIIVN